MEALYGDDCSVVDKIRLEDIQLMFARIIIGTKHGTSHALLYNETSWPQLSERRKVSKLKFIYKIIKGFAPGYLCDLLPPANDNVNNRYPLRNSHSVNQYFTRTEKFRKSTLPDCIRQFNALPLVTRNSYDITEFVRQISESFSSNLLYNGINRKLGVIHAQFRMKCSNLKAHLFQLHVVDDPYCICSNQIENCEHFFFHCHLYFSFRDQFLASLRLICNDNPITTELLLFGSDELSYEKNRQIFELVESFIDESSRFVT